jgi:hypothetical protein
MCALRSVELGVDGDHAAVGFLQLDLHVPQRVLHLIVLLA